ncbi:MAG: phage tail tape measure protein, partial [Enterocloster citroniae]|nr:phage tail tape measure protein [Enterocloster citroniae]
QKEKISIYRTALANAADAEKKAADKVNDLKKKLEDAKKRMSEMEKASDTTSEELEEQQRVVSELEKELGKAETGFVNAEKNTAKWQTSLNNAEAELHDLDSELKKNDGYLDEAERSTDNTAKSIDEYGDEVVEAKRETSTFGDVLKANLTSTAIISAVKKLAGAVKEVSGAVIQVGSDFDYAMSKVQSLCGATGKDLEDLRDLAKEIGASTKFSATEAAEGLQYMALAGWDTNEMLDGLGGVVSLAAAADMDLARASDILTDSMTALGDSAQDANRYADVLAKTQASSNTTVDLLGESFTNCAATAGAYGFSLEDVASALGVMANAGIKGSMAGTNLSIIMSRLATNTGGARDTLEELGVEFFDNQGNCRDLGDVIVELCDATKDMTDKEKAAIVTSIAGKNAQKSLNAILNQGSEAYLELNGTLENCTGAAQQMSDIMEDNLQGDITKLKSTTEALGITLYEKFEGAFRSAAQTATESIADLNDELQHGGIGRAVDDLADAFADAAGDVMEFAKGALEVAIEALTWLIDNREVVIGVLAGIGTGLLVFKVAPIVETCVTAIRGFIAATESAGVAQAAFNVIANMNPYVLLATAIGAAVTALVIFASNCEATKTETDLLIESTRELNEEMDDIAEKADESTKAWDDQVVSLDAEGTATENLAGKLIELSESSETTRASKQRMLDIIDKLNEMVPGLTLAIDEETGALNMSKEAILEAVEANVAYNKAKAAQEKLSEITSQQVDMEIALAEAEDNVAKIEEKLAGIQEERNRICEEGVNGYVEYNGVTQDSYYALCDLSDQEWELNEARDEAVASMEGLRTSYDELDATYETVYGYMEQHIEESGYIVDAYGNIETEVEETAEVTEEAMESMEESVEDATQTIIENISDQIDMFAAFNGEMALTTEELLTNMQSQIDGVNNWSANIQTLADRGINQGLLQYLADMGPDGAGYVATFAAMTDEELEKANQMWAESITLAETAGEEVAEATGVMVDELENSKEGIKNKAKEVGENIPAGMIEGINVLSNEAREELLNSHKSMLDGSYTFFDLHSPSRVYKDIGENLMQGLSDGITGNSDAPSSSMRSAMQDVVSETNSTLGTGWGSSSVFSGIGANILSGLESGISGNSYKAVNEASSVAYQAMSAMDKGLYWGNFDTIGGNVISGLVGGIYGGASSVVSAISSVCSNAIWAAKYALGIASPSKVFKELGAYTAEGFAIGYEEEMPEVNAMIADSVKIPSFASGELALAGGGRVNAGQMDLASMLAEYLPFLKVLAEKNTDIYLDRTKLTGEMDRSLGRMQKFAERG